MNNKQPTYTQTGKNVYEVDERGKSRFWMTVGTTGDAINLVRRLNELTEIVNSGLGIDDVLPDSDNPDRTPWVKL